MSIDLEAIRARAEEATQGPWKVMEQGNTVPSLQVVNEVLWENPKQIKVCSSISPKREADADFIAHAREDIPALLAEVKRQAEKLAAVTAERDAAVEDLRKNRARKCDCCAYAGRSERWPCVDCQSSISNYGDGWQWSGAGKEQNDG